MKKLPRAYRLALCAISFLAVVIITDAAASADRLRLITTVRDFAGFPDPTPRPLAATDAARKSKVDLVAAAQFFAGDGSSFSSAKWASTSAGPFVDPFVPLNTVNFAKANGTGTGASIAVSAINATENFTLTASSGTISNISNGVIAINVASGKTLDFSNQAFSSSPTAGYSFTGPGVLAMAGNTYGGGFTINSGTLVIRGVNAMGGSAANTLTINGGTIAATTSQNFFATKFGGGISVGGNFQFGELSSNVPIAASNASLTFNNNVNLGTATRTITIGGTGGYTFAGIVSGSPGVGLTVAKTTGGIGELFLSAANTYTGNTTITNGALGLVGSGSVASSPTIEIGAGGTFDITPLTASLTLVSGQAIRASGTNSSGTIALSSTKNLSTSATSPIQFTAFNGTTPPLTLSGAGILTLQPGNPVTVTVSHGGVPLVPGDYKLIAKGATGSVTGTPTALTVNGDGVSGAASLLNTNGELYLHVVVSTPTVTVDTASTGFTGDFGVVSVGANSSEQHYKVSGTNIDANGIVITAPSGFQVSPTSGSGFSSSFTVTGSGTIPATDVFIRFQPLSTGAAGGNITNAANGATTQNVVVTGTGAPPATPVMQFDSGTYSGVEAGTATVSVTRSGDLSGTSTVDYTSTNGSAASGTCGSSGVDYVASTGTLTFGPGVASRTFDVTLCGDQVSEDPAETVNLTLRNAVNGTVGTQGSATLSILDAATQFVNLTPILTTDGNPGSPNPSTIEITGQPTVLGGIRLTLFNVNRATSSDLLVLLVGPGGQTFVAMASVGGSDPMNGTTITLEDTAPAFMPQAGGITNGQNYKPTDCGVTSGFGPPAPAPPYNEPGCGAGFRKEGAVPATFRSTFAGTDPNGTWSLYIKDDAGLGLTDLSGGGDSIGGWGMQLLFPTAAPASISGQVRTASGVGIRNVVVSVSGGNLPQPLSVATGSFGYFSFGGLTAGQAYIVSVNSRHYTFTQPIRVIELLDDVHGFDFVADQ